MKKYLVLTIALGNAYKTLGELTHPSIKAYAEKIGADFMAVTERKISQTTAHWEKFQIHDLLNDYERILYIDTDIIIREDCPNLFDLVPNNQLGMFNEGKFTDRSKELMIDICRQYGVTLPNWDGEYYNTGVIVISRCHKSLFKKPSKEIFSFYEQSYLNMRIAEDKIHKELKMYGLSHYYNRMTCMDRFTGEDRFASYIIHYAGYPNIAHAINLVPLDLARWEEDKKTGYKYKTHVMVSVNGGLGDQVDAEPVIRYMRKNIYPDADVIVVTHWPELFKHLDLPVYQHGKFFESDLYKRDVPYYVMTSLPGPETVTWAVVSNLLCNSVDYVSIAMLKRTLPLEDKTIKLTYSESDLKEVQDMLKGVDLKELTLVHAGRHWESKTLPKDWWQKLVDELAADGHKLCMIGKNEETRGVWDLVLPEGTKTTVDLLSLNNLIALISQAKLLVSNDSAPVHLAGAFDNYIAVIPTCKHPDHIVPWRKRSLDYKTIRLYKRLTIDDIKAPPTQVYEVSGAEISADWSEYLLPPEEAVKRIKDGISNS